MKVVRSPWSVVKVLQCLALCAMLFTLSFPVKAQQAKKVWRIGLFHVGLDHVPPSLEPLQRELRKLGYEEGKTIHLDWRNLLDEDAARKTAKEFVRDRVDLIVAFEEQTVRAAKAATSEIPVVFLHVEDPVASGFVKSLSRPDGNMTGFITWPVSPDKQVELFKELVPRLRRLLVLIHPKDPVGQRWLVEVRKAGEVLKIKLVEREATNQADIERILRSVNRGEVDGIFVSSQILRTNFTAVMVSLAFEKHLPLAVHRKEWVEQGGLFSYATDLASIGRAAAPYVDKILQGTKPAELPVQQAMKFEFFINLKTAKALGLTIPPRVLARADKVIK